MLNNLEIIFPFYSKLFSFLFLDEKGYIDADFFPLFFRCYSQIGHLSVTEIMTMTHRLPWIFLCDVLGNSTCVLQNALIENIYTENELVVGTHWNHKFFTPKINLSVYSIQGFLRADSKDRIRLERLITDFFSHDFFRALFWNEFFIYLLTCSLFAHDFLPHTRKQATV